MVPRDYRLLQLLFEHKVLSRQQIQKYIFGATSKQCVNRRMAKLRQLGLVERVAISVDTHPNFGFSLTTKGLSLIKPRLSYEVSGIARKSECEEHDTDLFAIRMALEKCKMVSNYITENTLQSCKAYFNDEKYCSFVKVNSDAALSVDSKIGDIRIALEYERSKKQSSRYRDKLAEYYRSSEIDGVLYVCKETEIQSLVLKADAEVSKSFESDCKVYCVSLTDVLSSKTEIVFTNADGYVLRIR